MIELLLLEPWGVNLGFMDLFLHYICIFSKDGNEEMQTNGARQDDGEKAAS